MTTTISGSTGVNQITDDAITAAKLPTGSVLQVVMGTNSTQVAMASATHADVGLEATITPSSTSSKILILWNASVNLQAADCGAGTRLLRGATNIYSSTHLYDVYQGLSNDQRVRPDYKHLDSPSTTSAIVYKVQAASYGGKAIRLNNNSLESQITLMEIAG